MPSVETLHIWGLRLREVCLLYGIKLSEIQLLELCLWHFQTLYIISFLVETENTRLVPLYSKPSVPETLERQKMNRRFMTFYQESHLEAWGKFLLENVRQHRGEVIYRTWKNAKEILRQEPSQRLFRIGRLKIHIVKENNFIVSDKINFLSYFDNRIGSSLSGKICYKLWSCIYAWGRRPWEGECNIPTLSWSVLGTQGWKIVFIFWPYKYWNAVFNRT